jgi:hypothetical protein
MTTKTEIHKTLMNTLNIQLSTRMNGNQQSDYHQIHQEDGDADEPSNKATGQFNSTRVLTCISNLKIHRRPFVRLAQHTHIKAVVND